MGSSFSFVNILLLVVGIGCSCVSANIRRDERGLVDFGSSIVGGAIGEMGNLFYPLEEQRFKCVNVMGYGFSGPNSKNPEKYEQLLPESESTGILSSASKAVGLAWGTTFKTFLPEKANEEICLTIGMGYHEAQPGYPKTPGGGGPLKPGDKDYGWWLPQQPGVIIVQGAPGSVQYQPGQPGSVQYQQGQPGSVQYQPGQPGTVQYQPGTPGSVQYQPGTPGTVQYQPGTPGSVQYQQGTPSQQMCQCPCSG